MDRFGVTHEHDSVPWSAQSWLGNVYRYRQCLPISAMFTDIGDVYRYRLSSIRCYLKPAEVNLTGLSGKYLSNTIAPKPEGDEVLLFNSQIE